MKTRQELDALKEELYALKDKLAELTEEELEQVSGGAVFTGNTRIKNLLAGPLGFLYLEDELIEPNAKGKLNNKLEGTDENEFIKR